MHADTPSLEEIGKLVDMPLDRHRQGRRHGHRQQRELQATGNVTGDGVKYGDNGALTISSDYTAKVPDLTVADANVVGDHARRPS